MYMYVIFVLSYHFEQTMNADVYRGPWGGANCRDSLAQPLRTCNCPQGMRGGCEGRGVSE